MSTVRSRRGERAWRVSVSATAAALYFILVGCEEENPPEWVRLPAELKVEIARTPEEKERGLMFRKHLPRDQGMYFVYEREEWLSFYMRNTRIPLTIAFITSDETIESIRDMIPLDERPISSSHPAQFALEVNRGWFHENGIRPGDRLSVKGNRVFFFRRAER